MTLILNRATHPAMATWASYGDKAIYSYYDQLVELVQTNKSLHVLIEATMGNAGWGLAGVMVGGTIGGPVGAVIGGLTGAVYGAAVTKDYTLLLRSMKSLTPAQKRNLVISVQDLVGSENVSGLKSFLSSQDHRRVLVELLQSFCHDINK